MIYSVIHRIKVLLLLLLIFYYYRNTQLVRTKKHPTEIYML